MSYSRWATNEELKERLEAIKIGEKIEKAGIPIAYDQDHLYIDSHESNNLIIGSTGSGKTQACIMPYIKLSMLAGESIVVNDPLGELYETHAEILKEKGYNTILLNFDDARYGNSWNPLNMPYQLYKNGEKDRAIKCVEDIAYYMFYDAKDKNSDPFWINSVINCFTGVVLYLFENAKEDEINLLSVYHFSNYLVNSDSSKKIINKLDKQGQIYMNLVGVIAAPTETKGSILSVYNQKMKAYVSREMLTNMLADTDFDLSEINSKKTALFIVSGQSSYGNNFIPLLINQIIDYVKYNKNDKYLNILLDEFDSMVPIKDFARIVEFCRAIKIRITVTIRSFIHLYNMYTKEDAEILKLCFGNIIYLLSDDIYTLDEISKLCGNTEDGTPLITIEDLKTLKMFESIVLMKRVMPIKTKLIPDYKINYNLDLKKCSMEKRKENTCNVYKEEI